MNEKEYYEAFWKQFRTMFQLQHSGWKIVGDCTKNHQHFEAEYPGSNYSAAFVTEQRSGDYPDFFVELEASPKLFKSLNISSKRIEEAFGHPLIWEPPNGQEKRRITCRWGGRIEVCHRQRWGAITPWAVTRLGELRAALKPYIQQLRGN